MLPMKRQRIRKKDLIKRANPYSEAKVLRVLMARKDPIFLKVSEPERI